MIASLFRQKLLLCVVGIGVLIAGFFAYRDLPVDAFPDVSPALVQVFTETDGLAPEEVERYVTYPVEVAMAGLPGLKEVRSISNFGLSVVNVYFEDSTDIYFARQLVGERLQIAREEIPAGFGDPEMGPITTGLGQILFYFVVDESGKRSAEEVREIQDWIIKFNLQTVPGVTEVLSLGGEVKQFHVNVRPEALLRYDLSIADIVSAVRVNNGNIGAQYIVKNSEQFLVRSVGLANDIPDIENVVLKVFDGVAVRVRDVGTVSIGGEVRQGLATLNGKGEAVAGLVLKLIGTNTSEVISSVKQRLAQLEETVPPGIRVVPYYDQSKLVQRSVATVNQALASGHRAGGDCLAGIYGRFSAKPCRRLCHPVLNGGCLHSDGGHGPVRQSHVARRHCHCHRHDGRWRNRDRRKRRSATEGRTPEPFERSTGVPCLHGGIASDRVCNRHHYRCLPAPVHPARRRGQDLPPAGFYRCSDHAGLIWSSPCLSRRYFRHCSCEDRSR